MWDKYGTSVMSVGGVWIECWTCVGGGGEECDECGRSVGRVWDQSETSVRQVWNMFGTYLGQVLEVVYEWIRVYCESNIKKPLTHSQQALKYVAFED